MPNLYALLVGIDTYPIPGHQLQGCVNDATSMQSLLQKRYAGANLHVQTLLNEQATRANMIAMFRSHLGQAQTGDIAFFFFAGHGSQVPTGGLFQEIEPSGLNSSLVCWDSRMPGNFDLVDKDFATLIGEITSRGVHITLVLDACHSGSATRDITDLATRQIPARPDAQPASGYLKDPAAISAALRNTAAPAGSSVQLTLTTASSFVPDLTGLQVLLAACQPSEVANEYLAGNVHHGAFTFCLLQVLNSTAQALGYHEVYQRARALVAGCVPSQTPQLVALAGDKSLENQFLGLTPAPLPNFFVTSYMNGAWQMTGGLLNSVHVGDQVALYAAEAGPAQPPLVSALATAAVASSTPSASTLQGETLASLSQSAQYKAFVTVGVRKTAIGMDGDAAGIVLLRTALGSSPLLAEGAAAQLLVHCSGNQFALEAVGTQRPVPGPFSLTVEGAEQAIAALEHMAKWLTRLSLQNPASALPVANIVFTMIGMDGSETNIPPLHDLQLSYTTDAQGQPQRPAFKLRVTNGAQQPLYFAMLALSQSWSISTGLVGSGTAMIGPGEQLFALEGQPIHTSISSPIATSTEDYILLIASTDSFDASSLALPSLVPTPALTRDIDDAPPAPAVFSHDFQTRLLHVITSRVQS